MTDLNTLEGLVEDWAKQRGILDAATPGKQLEKTLEEVVELVEAIALNDLDEAKDAIGDVTVTLIIIAKLYGWNLTECLNAAYDVISKRTGKIVDGIFVRDDKDADLDEPLGQPQACTDTECESCQ